jgi:hypothetical protein
LLPYTFNTLWTGFLNMRGRDGRPIPYFGMIHDDVIPDAGWLDALLGVLDETGADIVSAVVPIKDARGLTSTAADSTGDEWSPRRLAMRELVKLPDTFGERECHEHFGGPILLNTGLWVARFDRPWVEKVSFRQQDKIIRLPDGSWTCQTKPEDWDFSRQVRALGGKLLATRKVGLDHERSEWTNRRAWGTWESDYDVTRGPQAVGAKAL